MAANHDGAIDHAEVGDAWAAPRHPLRRISGRSTHEHRAATPLELLFDLAFVAAFGVAGLQMSHLLELGHTPAALMAFSFVMFAIIWAWINFTWFASAFDTDDWFYRLTTMVQMVGVVVLALGIPQVFESIDAGEGVDNAVMVAGYVVMRLAMVSQWLRVAMQAPEHRRTAYGYVVTLVIAQVGWVVLALLPLSLGQLLVPAMVMYLIELGGPALAESRLGSTPWHPHHIAERYGLLTIITMGEGVLGTVAAVQPITAEHGWTTDAIVLVAAGIALTFGLWWVYFSIPFGDVLATCSGSGMASFVFGYGHIVVFGGLAAVGAGLHVLAYLVEGTAHIDAAQAVQTIVIPVAVVLVALVLIYALLVRRVQPFYLGLFAASVAALIAAQLMANAGVSFAVCVMVAALAPAIIALGQETFGHRYIARHLEGLQSSPGTGA